MTIRTILIRYGTCAVPLLFLAAGARGQSLNVDLDIFFGDPSNGNGAPSTQFGGAAEVQGYWNRTSPGSVPEPLFDLAGQATSVFLSAPVGAGSYGGSNYPINTGDYALLLNDYARVPDELRHRFTGMRPGRYLIYTYAVDATGARIAAEVSVPGSSTPTQLVDGVMPGNAFVLGVTHSIHELDLVTNTFEIIVRNHVQGPPDASVNGFQIVAVVPEPASLAVLSFSILVAARRRRRL